ncbi:MAG: hypothetical protein JSW00_10225 [Thermoplasmata archaeon]|nr:MAG: hypothetical protein JSW00_10225 [Thermoplasmata archaeon]
MGFIVGGIATLGQSVSEYDDWVKDPSRSPGDTIKVTGVIEDETSMFGDYRYKFEGSDVPFYSGEDLGAEGDTVTVELVITDSRVPMVRSVFTQLMCWIPGIICLVIGAILIIVSFIVKPEQPTPYPPGYPQQYPQQQYPYQQYPPQQYPPQQYPPQQYPPQQPGY